MNDRDLVLKTLKHQACDTIPYQLNLTCDLEKKIISELGPDFLSTVDNCFALELNEEFSIVDSHRKKDMFGVVWLLDQTGDFGVVENCLLPEPTLKNYVFPKPDEEKIREKCARIVSEEYKQKFSMYTMGFSLYERAWSLRGVENLLMDMILNPSFVHELFENIVEYNLGVAKIAMEYPIDGISFGDDWGQQKGLIMGPKYWREFIKPSLNTMYSAIKSRGLYLCQHSCGDIHEVFGDLIDLGLDIYNTFQPEIYDVPKIKKEYGNDLTFYGGISTQQVLPFGTASEVKQATKNMMEIMGTQGGYVVAPTHSMPPDIPIENVLAFLEVVQNQ